MKWPDKQFTKGYGAITFRVGSKERAFKIINALKIPNIVSNIGNTDTGYPPCFNDCTSSKRQG